MGSDSPSMNTKECKTQQLLVLLSYTCSLCRDRCSIIHRRVNHVKHMPHSSIISWEDNSQSVIIFVGSDKTERQ